MAALAVLAVTTGGASAQTNPPTPNEAIIPVTPSAGPVTPLAVPATPPAGPVAPPTASLQPAAPPALTAAENAAAQSLLNTVSTQGGTQLVSDLQVSMRQYVDQKLNVKSMIGLVRAGAGNKLGLVNRAIQSLCSVAVPGSSLADQTCEPVDIAKLPKDDFPEVGAVGGTDTNAGGGGGLGPSTGNAVGNGNGTSPTTTGTGSTSTFSGTTASVTPYSGTTSTTTSTLVIISNR